jgi:hypothetical protein
MKRRQTSIGQSFLAIWNHERQSPISWSSNRKRWLSARAMERLSEKAVHDQYSLAWPLPRTSKPERSGCSPLRHMCTYAIHRISTTVQTRSCCKYGFQFIISQDPYLNDPTFSRYARLDVLSKYEKHKDLCESLNNILGGDHYDVP